MDRDLHGYIAKKFDLIAGRLGGWHSEGGTELDGIVTDLTEEVYGAICLAVEARNAMDRKFPQYATPHKDDPVKCGCSEFPECTHALYWYQGYKDGQKQYATHDSIGEPV